MSLQNTNPELAEQIAALRNDVEELKRRRIEFPEGDGCCICDSYWRGTGGPTTVTIAPANSSAIGTLSLTTNEQNGNLSRTGADVVLAGDGGLVSASAQVEVTSTGDDPPGRVNVFLVFDGNTSREMSFFAPQTDLIVVSLAHVGQMYPTAAGSCPINNGGRVSIGIAIQGNAGDAVTVDALLDVFQLTEFGPCINFVCETPA